MSAEQTPDIAAYVVAEWTHRRWRDPHPPEPFNIQLRASGATGAHALMAECAVCHEVLTPATFALAPVLAAAVREAEQRALREAAHRLTQMAVMEFDAHGPNAPRGAAIWDSAQWLQGRADRITEPVSHERGPR